MTRDTVHNNPFYKGRAMTSALKMHNALKTTEAELTLLLQEGVESPDARIRIEALLIIVNAAMFKNEIAAYGADEFMNAVMRDVATERARQIFVKGWSDEHDDGHADGSLAQVAACYAAPPDFRYVGPRHFSRQVQTHDETLHFCDVKYVPLHWPSSWHGAAWDGSHERRRELVIAGALIVAEIERLDRAASAGLPPNTFRGSDGFVYENQVRSGCAVRDEIVADQINAAAIGTTALEDAQRKYNAAIDYALLLDPSEGINFLHDWREGDVSNWPAFPGPKP